jgi:hypothetical protein
VTRSVHLQATLARNACAARCIENLGGSQTPQGSSDTRALHRIPSSRWTESHPTSSPSATMIDVLAASLDSLKIGQFDIVAALAEERFDPTSMAFCMDVMSAAMLFAMVDWKRTVPQTFVSERLTWACAQRACSARFAVSDSRTIMMGTT